MGDELKRVAAERAALSKKEKTAKEKQQSVDGKFSSQVELDTKGGEGDRQTAPEMPPPGDRGKCSSEW